LPKNQIFMDWHWTGGTMPPKLPLCFCLLHDF
jgi:hypothetical protein